MRPQFSGITITSTKKRFSRPGRLIAPKTQLNRDDGALLPKEYLNLTLANKKK